MAMKGTVMGVEAGGCLVEDASVLHSETRAQNNMIKATENTTVL